MKIREEIKALCSKNGWLGGDGRMKLKTSCTNITVL